MKRTKGEEKIQKALFKHIGIINRTEKKEEIVSPKYSSIAYERKQSATSRKLNINTVKNKKKKKKTGNKSETKKTLRNIDKFNIKRYDKNIQKYLDRRRKFNISTREKRNAKKQSILY